jgi:integrase
MGHAQSRQKKIIRIVNRFLEFCNMNAEELLNETRQARRNGDDPPVYARLSLWQDRLLNVEKLSPNSVQTYRHTILSFVSQRRPNIGGEKVRVPAQTIETTFEPLKKEEVKALVRTVTKPRKRAVISFLAQTGQRVGLLTAIRWNMIKMVDSHGIASIPDRLDDYKGESVRKGDTPYKFVIGSDTMKLLEEMPETKRRRDEGDFVFGVSERTLARDVVDAREGANLAEQRPRRIPGLFAHRVHAHSLRVYWKNTVSSGAKRMDNIQSEYMMGHHLPADWTYRRGMLQEGNLLKAYRRIEDKLRVL